MTTRMEYVTVNENRNLWEIDFDEGVATETGQRITLDDLKLNGKDWSEYNGAIIDYIQEKGRAVINVYDDKITFEKA